MKPALRMNDSLHNKGGQLGQLTISREQRPATTQRSWMIMVAVTAFVGLGLAGAGWWYY
ncbi:MAG: hypothetical protein HOP29_10135, partial [Phycisphaerales bacterium]|nr:hypothetical protein [Phycisphaerales bacterium]